MNIELKDFNTVIAALITSGTFYTVIKFVFRMKSETGAVIVKSAEGVVVLQTGIIKDLKAENEALRKEIKELRLRVQQLEDKLDKTEACSRECEKHIAQLEHPK